MLLVFAMKCCTKIPCPLPHNHYCFSLPSPAHLYMPHLFTHCGGMAPECNKVNKRLAEKIAEKHREPYASAITYIQGQSSDLPC